MADVVAIDSAVLIGQRQGNTNAHAFLDPLVRGAVACIHPVTAAEVLAGATDARSLGVLDRFLGSFRMLPVKNTDWAAALSLFRSHHLSHSIGWPDCLIAATCVRLDLPLATTNVKHFRAVRGLSVLRPY